MYYKSTKRLVLVCVKDKRDLYQQEHGLQVRGHDASPPFSTCEPTAGVVPSFGLLSRRETLTNPSEYSTGHQAGQGLEPVVHEERLRDQDLFSLEKEGGILLLSTTT